MSGGVTSPRHRCLESMTRPVSASSTGKSRYRCRSRRCLPRNTRIRDMMYALHYAFHLIITAVILIVGGIGLHPLINKPMYSTVPVSTLSIVMTPLTVTDTPTLDQTVAGVTAAPTVMVTASPTETLSAIPSITPTAFGSNTGKIVFARDEFPSYDIFVVDADGSNQRPLAVCRREQSERA